MITVTARHAAAAVFTCSGIFVLGMGVFGLIRNGLTLHEVISGAAGLAVAAVAALWLRRENRHGGTS